MPALPSALPFVGIGDLGDAPHVVVDGAPRAGSVCVLSHWPVTTTPPALARDLSAEIAFAYLEQPEFWASDAQAVTNDHFDADGLAAMYVVVDPTGAMARREAIVGLARVGDFGKAHSRTIARSSFAIGAMSERARSPFARACDDSGGWAAWMSCCYRELLSMLPALLDDPEDFEAYWIDEDLRYAASLEARAAGTWWVEEPVEASELAVAHLAADSGALGSYGVADDSSLPIHPVALFSATDAVRLLVVHGPRYWYLDRYETWVRFVTRRLPLRRDLTKLAAGLTAMEQDRAAWTAGSPAGIEPVLHLEEDAPSSLSANRVIEELHRALVELPPAWDPFVPGGRPV